MLSISFIFCFSLIVVRTVVVYDARCRDIIVEDACPSITLPRLPGRLRAGDIVWLGFRVRMETETAVFPIYKAFADVCWVILLSRTGNRGLSEVKKSFVC